MVAKKRGLYLGLLLSILGMGGIAQAGYKFKFVNNTQYEVGFHIFYHKPCRSDVKVVRAGKIKNVKSKSLCPIEYWVARVYDGQSDGARGTLEGTLVRSHLIYHEWKDWGNKRISFTINQDQDGEYSLVE